MDRIFTDDISYLVASVIATIVQETSCPRWLFVQVVSGYYGICSAPPWSSTNCNILRYFGICSAPLRSTTDSSLLLPQIHYNHVSKAYEILNEPLQSPSLNYWTLKHTKPLQNQINPYTTQSKPLWNLTNINHLHHQINTKSYLYEIYNP